MTQKPKETDHDWITVWNEHRPAEPTGSSWIKKILKKLLRKPGDVLLSTRLEQQRRFNLFVVEEYERRFTEHREWIQSLHKDIVGVQENLHKQIVQIQNHFQNAFNELQRDTLRLRDEVVPALKEETEMVLGSIDAKAEWALARVRRLLAKVSDRVVESMDARSLEEFSYAGFEDEFRGSFQAIKKDLGFYLDRVRDHEPVWDLGCGRGEFLELLKEEGIASMGVEGNEVLARDLSTRELPVIQGNYLDVLKSQKDQSIGCITLFHCLEHHDLKEIKLLLHSAFQKLSPGGFLIAELPNTAALTGLFNFFKDPGHITPWHPETITHYLKEAGFKNIQVVDRHPVPPADQIQIPDNTPRALTNLLDHINRMLYGFQDFAVIAEKGDA